MRGLIKGVLTIGCVLDGIATVACDIKGGVATVAQIVKAEVARGCGKA